MDDFDYSVEISDRDWQCFFTECEECNLLPPSLAGVDDSGMSDLDDTASLFARRAPKRDLTAGLSEAGGPPLSRSPPVAHYLCKQGASGMESVLSGSEEDIHLQCVNMFFERLGNLPEAERPDEPSQDRPGKNREAELQRGEADIISNNNTRKEVKPGVSLEPAASNSAMNANGLAHPQTEGAKVKPECHDSPTPETAPHTDTAIKAHACTLDGVRRQHLSTDLLSSREKLEGPDVLQPESKAATQQPSPSASVKRKRRRKRRPSIDPVESGLGCERQLLGGQRPDDSEEERRPWRGTVGFCFPECSSYPLTRTSAKEVGVNYSSDPVELSGLGKYGWVPCSVAASVAGKLDGGTGNSERIDTESLQQCNEVNHVDCERRSTAEAKSITRGVLPRARSNNPEVEVSQDDNLSVAKSVLAVEGGSRYEHTLCQRGAEQQQQLETDGDQYSSTPGKTGICEAVMMRRDASDVNASASPFPHDLSCKDAGAKPAEGCTNMSPGQNPLSVNETPSDISPPTPCCTLDTVTSHSNDTITDVSARFCSSISQNESEGERWSVMLETEATGPKRPTVSGSKSDAVVGAGDGITPGESEHKAKTAPDSRPSIFTMSSFWSEMEKLTINDILGLRMAGKAAPRSSLCPLQEHEEVEAFTTSIFTQPEDSAPDSEPSGLASVLALESPAPGGVTWESEAIPVSPVTDVYPQNITLTTAISPAIFPEGAETCLKKISKNTSVHNLHALESELFSSAGKHRTLPNLDKGGSEKVRYVPEEIGPSPSSLTGGYSTSIGDMFRYLFGRKEPVPSPSATNNVTTSYADGSTLPETYDHFFCDYDIESFFCPLVTAADAKEELVPIFSCSHSANRSLQFPEAYDYFFPSSSSDDSCVESDDDENPGPVRATGTWDRTSSGETLSPSGIFA
ncbi:PGC-1 and ERR-induced regulator in muscle protein 1 isoform X2 [Betta splendens]|uniref:PGC-1 and ERR-induced regulator in muscle protein 1 isoform X2 n=1 Tax=Betta splendens TaxID=158456 RepID=A0A9W2XX00_BETSP|nr:PGC-1 and ERR-induced regulator in muscle protein 1 isoform X2 [Betta splendens]